MNNILTSIVLMQEKNYHSLRVWPKVWTPSPPCQRRTSFSRMRTFYQVYLEIDVVVLVILLYSHVLYYSINKYKYFNIFVPKLSKYYSMVGVSTDVFRWYRYSLPLNAIRILLRWNVVVRFVDIHIWVLKTIVRFQLKMSEAWSIFKRA